MLTILPSEAHARGLVLWILTLLFIGVSAAITALAQEQPRRIGSIDFYGYADLNLDQIRAGLPVHAGDRFPGSSEIIDGIRKICHIHYRSFADRHRTCVLRCSRQLHDLYRAPWQFDQGDKIQSRP